MKWEKWWNGLRSSRPTLSCFYQFFYNKGWIWKFSCESEFSCSAIPRQLLCMAQIRYNFIRLTAFSIPIKISKELHKFGLMMLHIFFRINNIPLNFKKKNSTLVQQYIFLFTFRGKIFISLPGGCKLYFIKHLADEIPLLRNDQ